MPRPLIFALLPLICCLTFFAHRVDADDSLTLDPANAILRGDFQNARILFEREHRGHVAFIGGSITEMDGYRPMVMKSLQERFPDTKFTFTDAGISSTCSTTGAFRLQRDVLDKGPVDLFFVEFAVNDDQDAMHSREAAIRGMEGIIRHARLHNPNADIVLTYFVNPGMLATSQQKKTPLSIAAHEAVAEHYQIPAIRLARQVASSISAGDLSWDVYGGTHPKPAGNRIAADLIDQLLDAAWKGDKSAEDAKLAAHPLPEPMDADSYFRGRLLDLAEVDLIAKATVKVPDWDALPGGKRGRFKRERLLCLEGVGAECSLKFSGTAIGAYVLAGPDAATVEVSIDGGEFQPVELYHHHSKGLHYPRTVMFATDLSNDAHQIKLRVAASPEHPGRQVARILNFVAN
ncbi:SGNH/GDSL hydrolase family protein [Rosistilla oblonga]|uniref:SGNH hydrolase-type esterase domain-containing protein n=1 Tax=Rosistilla oblonga TaxID=2527990 RepID=A0A518IQT5_9BACT|nr:GDSL-type esterase/lipase family protein [Rosistilla oblonga]QDV55445.1 hypothetical protein Mal33_14190 [Rosistilla oblonga]